MDDFLHKLRNSRNKPNYDRNRRPTDAFPYRGSERKKNRGRKSSAPAAANADYLPAVKKALDALIDNQKEMIDLANARLDVERHKTGLMAKVLERLDDLLDSSHTRQVDVQTQPGALRQEPAARADAAPEAGRPAKADRKKVIAIIQGLRKEGKSYESIAQHLETENIPTLSGRGRWRSQSIHRLYKELA